MSEEVPKPVMKTGHEWDRDATTGANLERGLAELEALHSRVEPARQQLIDILRANGENPNGAAVLEAHRAFEGASASYRLNLELFVKKAAG